MKRASVRILLIAEVPGTGSVPTAGRGRAHAAPVARVNVAAPATTATVAGPGAMGTGAAAGLLAADSMGPGDSTTRGAATTVEVAPTATTHRVPRAARDALIPQASPDPGMRVRQAGAPVLAEEWLMESDCPLVDTSPWADRPTVATSDPRVVLAGDLVRCDLPVALMERAATTGWQAANQLLTGWGRRGHTVWSPPTRGLLARAGS